MIDYPALDDHTKLKIKGRIKELRQSRNIRQEDVADSLGVGRNAVTNWERIPKDNNEQNFFPSLYHLLLLCNYFTVDIDYLLGRTSVKSKDTNTISTALHISENTVNTLRNNKKYGQLLNKIIGNENFGEISNRVHQLALNRALDDVITTCLNRKLEKKVESIFTEYYFSDFPFNMSQKNYCEYIKNSIPYSEDFNPEKFIEDNFLEDGRNVIKNKSDNFSSLSKSEKYEIVMSSIADITYDYYISKNLAELSKQKLDMMLSKLLQDVIEEEVEEIKAKLINNIH